MPGNTSRSSPSEHFPYGVWEADGGALTLDFNEDDCQWSTRRSDGKVLVRNVPITRMSPPPNPMYRIERANDEEVVRFALDDNPNFREEWIAQALRIGPAPSYVELKPGRHLFDAEFNGIKVGLAECEDRWFVDSIRDPGTPGAVRNTYILSQVGDDAAYFIVSAYQLTFDAEGGEGGRYHSRRVHWPGGNSGVTCGRGLDMGGRRKAEVKGLLVAAGMEAVSAERFADGAGKRGTDAERFVTAANGNGEGNLGNISPGQQQRLFTLDIPVYVGRVLDRFERFAPIYGPVEYPALHPKIWEVLVDMAYVGHYNDRAMPIVQPFVVDNDLAGFTRAMSVRRNWPNVAPDRFQRRVDYLTR